MRVNAVLQAEKDKVENAVRNYLAEKPAEDALREKELQQARSETENLAQELQKAKDERDALKVSFLMSLQAHLLPFAKGFIPQQVILPVLLNKLMKLALKTLQDL